MPVPTNLTQGTAVELGPQSNAVYQRVDDGAGTTYTVWYQYTAQPGDTVIVLFAFGDLTVYTPTLSIVTTDPNFPAPFAVTNIPQQIPVTPGFVYALRVLPNSGNPSPANLVISLYRATDITRTAPAGSILIQDDSQFYAAALLSSGGGKVLRFVYPVGGFPASEVADVLNSGEVCSIGSAGLLDSINFTDPQLNIVASVNAGNFVVAVTTNTTSNFYVSDGASTVKVFSKTGALLKTITLSTNGIAYIGVNNGETILYYTGVFANFGAVKRWDLVNNVALSNLAAAIASFSTQDIIVLADGTILVMYTGSTTQKCLHYSAAGAVLNTYLFNDSAAPDDSLQRICRAIDDPNSFWSFQHLPSPKRGTNRFKNIRVSDGVILTQFDSMQYEHGNSLAAATATPFGLGIFGASESCPIVITRAQIPAGCF